MLLNTPCASVFFSHTLFVYPISLLQFNLSDQVLHSCGESRTWGQVTREDNEYFPFTPPSSFLRIRRESSSYVQARKSSSINIIIISGGGGGGGGGGVGCKIRLNCLICVAVFSIFSSSIKNLPTVVRSYASACLCVLLSFVITIYSSVSANVTVSCLKRRRFAFVLYSIINF